MYRGTARRDVAPGNSKDAFHPVAVVCVGIVYDGRVEPYAAVPEPYDHVVSDGVVEHHEFADLHAAGSEEGDDFALDVGGIGVVAFGVVGKAVDEDGIRGGVVQLGCRLARKGLYDEVFPLFLAPEAFWGEHELRIAMDGEQCEG